MAHSEKLMVIFIFDIGVGRDSNYVKLQDWHTKCAFELREMIWTKSKGVFSKCGLDDPMCLQLWYEGDDQPLDLHKKLRESLTVDAELVVEIFITASGATKHDEPLALGSAGTFAAPSTAVTARSDALSGSDSFVSMAASRINSECFDTLRRAAQVELQVTDAFRQKFDNLMEASAVCSRWVNVSEPGQLQVALSEVKGCVDLPAYLTWDNCSRQPATVWWGNDVQLTAENDILLYHRSHGDVPELACILGIEVKKNMQRRDMFEALGQFLCWGGLSRYPFVQLLTDMVTGGVFIFAAKKDGTTVHIQTECYVDMEGVKDFVKMLVGGLPPKLGSFHAPISESLPDKLRMPERIEISKLTSRCP